MINKSALAQSEKDGFLKMINSFSIGSKMVRFGLVTLK